MTKTSKTIVFFGSGPVAAQSLELLTKNFTIEAVVTKPKPEHHRGNFPVLDVADRLGLKTFTPANRSELSELFATQPVESQVGVVIDYGIIINQDVIDYFPFGIVNSHFSLLPELRGADPITFSILSGQKRTGVSLMLIVAAMDEGPLLAQAPYDMPNDITTPELTEALIQISDESLAEVLPLYLDGKIDPAPQAEVTMADSKLPTYSRKLTKEDGLLQPKNKPADRLEREIRAYIEWPKSRVTIKGTDVIITKAHVDETLPGSPGNIGASGGTLSIGTTDGALVIDKLKPSGKPEMTAQAFLAGYQV